MKTKTVTIKNITVGNENPLLIISGPCVIESEEHTMQCAAALSAMMKRLKLPFIFKASFDKANRSSKDSFRGPGLEEGLRILEKVKNEFGMPVLTDVHEICQADAVAEVCDVLQIPAFLSRQTDLIFACAQTGKTIHVKKGQFMAPWDMGNVVNKIVSCDNQNIILCDRGACFGYNNLVSDMRAFAIMKRFGYPVSYDASHSVQLPSGKGDSTGGDREMIPYLSKAAVAAGADVLFIESHPTPETAKSDAPSIYPLGQLEALLVKVKAIHELVRS